MVYDKPGIDVAYMAWMLLQSVVCSRDNRGGLGVCQQVRSITAEIAGQTARQCHRKFGRIKANWTGSHIAG
jgi:hypothetical protein